MPIIRRTPEVENDIEFVTVSSPPSEIFEATEIAKKRYLSLIKNKSSSFGKALLYQKDSNIQYERADIDIVNRPGITRSFIDGISSFMKIELGTRVRGKLKKQITTNILISALESVERLTKSDITTAAIVKTPDVDIVSVICSSTGKCITIRVIDSSVIYEVGNKNSVQDISNGTRGLTEL